MAIVLYFFVLLIAAGSVLFGLDLMTSPLTSTPNVPIGRSVQRIAAAPPARQDNRSPAREEASREHAPSNDRALTPVYPASPGPSAPVVTTGVAPRDETVRAVGTAAVSPAPAQNSCDVQACGNAYHSFTAADCTYQPINGPRKLCTKSSSNKMVALRPAPKPQPLRRKSGGNEPAEAARKQQRSASAKPLQLHPASRAIRSNEPDNLERIVRKLTRGRDLGDIAIVDSEGRVTVVHTGGARAQAYR
jgi:hypothetical protein